MSDVPSSDTAPRRAVRRLLDALDRAVAAAREVELARAALDRAARRKPDLHVVAGEREDTHEPAHG
jgi:hypothetical protein